MEILWTWSNQSWRGIACFYCPFGEDITGMFIKPYVKYMIGSNLTGMYEGEVSSLLMQVLYQFIVHTERLGQHSMKKTHKDIL